MKGLFIALGIIFGVFILIVLSIATGIFTRSLDTVNKMADQTVFNASKHVYNYEDFYNKYEKYTQYQKLYESSNKRMEELDKAGKTSGQEYEGLVMQRTGTFQMMAQIASDYNKASSIWYQKVWKGKGLPERLE